MAPALMKNLFGWLKTSKDHLLIKSCVFHYEFEFVHPFSDGKCYDCAPVYGTSRLDVTPEDVESSDSVLTVWLLK